MGSFRVVGVGETERIAEEVQIDQQLRQEAEEERDRSGGEGGGPWRGAPDRRRGCRSWR